MAIMRKGVVPNDGVLLKTFGPKRSLALYQTGISKKWLSLKLVLVAGSAPKGNYVMYWDGAKIGGQDYWILHDHQQEIATEVLGYLKLEFPDVSGLASPKESTRTSEGVVPENAPKLGEIGDIDGVDWGVYDTVAAGPNNLGVKIVANERLVGRANYLLEWNGKRFIRDANFQRLAERLNLLAAAEEFMENLESVRVRLPDPENRTVPEAWTNLGPVGVVANLERDLLVYETTNGGVEVRLSTSDPDKPTDISFTCAMAQDEICAEGGLYRKLEGLPEVWARAEELLRKYFLEKRILLKQLTIVNERG